MTPRATFASTSTGLVFGQTISLPAISSGDRLIFVVALGTNDRVVTATIGGSNVSQISTPTIGSGALKLGDAGSYVFNYVASGSMAAGTSLVITHATLQSDGSAAPATRSSISGVIHPGYGSGYSVGYIAADSVVSSTVTSTTTVVTTPTITGVVEGTIELNIVTDAEVDNTSGTSNWSVVGNMAVYSDVYNTSTNTPQVSSAIGVKYMPTPFGPNGIGNRKWTATNNNSGISTTLWTIGYRPANVPPTANAGSDQTVDPFTLVTLNGSGTDSDGTITSFIWVQTDGPTVSLSGSGATRTFKAPGYEFGITLGFTLTVSDNNGASNSAAVAIHVLSATEFYLSSNAVWTPLEINTL